MKHIVVASTNPVKVQAALQGFMRMFTHEEFHATPLPACSDVSDQPRSDAEALQGALSRARHARQLLPTADYWVGIEGGIQDEGSDMSAFAWVVILGVDLQGKSRTGTFYLPPAVAELVRQGKELGEADDMVFNRLNSKQENGAIGILTGDVIDRMQLYQQAVILALVPFLNPDLYAV
jgi:inosine/xanthosine triphosphatase